MNLIVGAPPWLIGILLLALAAAAIEDAIRFRISNITCAIVFVAGLVAVAVQGFSPALWQNALICVAILAVGTWAFAAGWMGGGDVKLLAAIGLWLDLSAAVGLLLAVCIAGGVVALAYMAARRMVPSARRVSSKDSRVPYGLAIVAGAAFIFTTQLTDRHTNPFLDRLRAEQQARRLG